MLSKFQSDGSEDRLDPDPPHTCEGLASPEYKATGHVQNVSNMHVTFDPHDFEEDAGQYRL